MNRVGRILLICALVIGPLWAGSYYGMWRWPLLYCVSASIAILLVWPFAKNPGETTQKKVNWWLAPVLLLLVIQGIWMWYNAWGVFTRSPWHIVILENQPAPSLPGTTDRAEAFDRLSSIIPCLGLIWVTRNLVVSMPSMLRMITTTVFLTGVAVASLGLIQRWTGAEGIFWLEALNFPGRALFFGTFRSPGIASCFLNIALAMGLTRILRNGRAPSNGGSAGGSRRIAANLLRVAGVIVILTGVISAGSKAGMVFGLLTLVLWAALNRNTIRRSYQRSTELFSGHRRTERNMAAGVMLIIALLACLTFAGTVLERWEQAKESDFNSITGRGAVNAIQIEMIQDSDWGALGLGPGSFHPLFSYYAWQSDTISPHIVYFYSHNDFLQTLIEWGWLGTSAFAILIGGGVFFLIRELVSHKDKHRINDIIYMRGCMIAITMMLLHAMVDFPFQIESIAVTFSVILGTAWAAPQLRGK